MKESVIFALRSGGKILCENREYLGRTRHCILGGSIEPSDHIDSDYVQAATRREAKEELGVDVRVIHKIGDFTSGGTVFHVAMVESWSGDIPDSNIDNNNRLEWVTIDTLIPSIELLPLRELLEHARCTSQGAAADADKRCR
jgi:8-oxo-dGTP pyrophosphatase MutT (NUDIX family)